MIYKDERFCCTIGVQIELSSIFPRKMYVGEVGHHVFIMLTAMDTVHACLKKHARLCVNFE